MLVLCAIPTPTLAQSGADIARNYRETHEVEILTDFAELLNYPNRARDLDDITPQRMLVRMGSSRVVSTLNSCT